MTSVLLRQVPVLGTAVERLTTTRDRVVGARRVGARRTERHLVGISPRPGGLPLSEALLVTGDSESDSLASGRDTVGSAEDGPLPVVVRGAGQTTPTVSIVNPLGSALRHYSDALVEMLGDSELSVERYDVPEPAVSRRSRTAWLREYVAALVAARRDRSSLIVVTWPALGYLDLVLFRLLGLPRDRTCLVVHDPDPLVRSVGTGPVSRRIARLLGAGPRLLTHGEEARAAVASHGFEQYAVRVPHPVQRRSQARPSGEPEDRPVVRVLGCWKRDRDTDVLRRLRAALPSSIDLEIRGHGWPDVPGWRVVDAFVSELEFDELVRTSAVVLVPYRRVFQSGVAVRALELGTPFVGPRVSAHQALYPDLPELLVDTEGDVETRTLAWTTAIRAAISAPRAEITAARELAAGLARAGWAELVRSPGR